VLVLHDSKNHLILIFIACNVADELTLAYNSLTGFIPSEVGLLTQLSKSHAV
jgi:hypothetical protein